MSLTAYKNTLFAGRIKSRQELNFLAQLQQLEAGQGGIGLSQCHLWCRNDLARLWD